MAKESALWAWFRDGVDDYTSHEDDLQIQRVENLASKKGVPDIELQWGFMQAWIELKRAPRPAKAETAVKCQTPFTEEQKRWGKRRAAVGGNAWFLLSVDGRGKSKRYLLHPEDYDRVGCSTEAELQAVSLIPVYATPGQIIEAVYNNRAQ